MNKQLLIELKQKQSSLEFKEKDLTKLVDGKKRNKYIGIAMAIAGFLFFFALGGLSDSGGIFLLLVLIGIAGLVLWYINRKGYKKGKTELDSLNSEIEENKKQIIEVENS